MKCLLDSSLISFVQNDAFLWSLVSKVLILNLHFQLSTFSLPLPYDYRRI